MTTACIKIMRDFLGSRATEGLLQYCEMDVWRSHVKRVRQGEYLLPNWLTLRDETV